MFDGEKQRLESLPHDILVDRAFELIEQTNTCENGGYGYLEGRWEEGKHRKWWPFWTGKQFDEFVNYCGLVAEDVQTMGSLGAPGCGLGCSPAISFTSDDPDAIQSAYVTPLPEVRKESGDERDWERVRSAMLSVYG